MAPPGFALSSADEFFDVYEGVALEVLLVHRTARRPGNDELRTIAWALQGVLEPRWAGWGLVVDTRDASGTNDPRFEQDLVEWCEQASQHFRRVAILVRTLVGQRQASRHVRGLANAIATLDELEAHAWAGFV